MSPRAFLNTATRRQTYLLGLPLGVLAFSLSFSLKFLRGQAHVFDTFALPLMAVILALLGVAFWFKKDDFVVLETCILTSLGMFLLSKLAFVLSHQDSLAVMSELAGFIFWFPVFYAVAFWILGVRQGRTLATFYVAGSLVVSAALHAPVMLGGGGKEALHVLIQFYLSSGLMIIILNTLARMTQAQAQAALDMTQVAYTDALTGLGNRRLLETQLEAELARARAQAYDFSVVILDIDHFKSVNDTYGHNVGDDILRQLANLLRAGVRTSDHLGRWGGEEFLMILPALNCQQAQELCVRLKQNIANHSFTGAGSLTVSLGVAVYTPEDDCERLLGRADEALYRAKHAGRNRVMAA